MDHNHRYLTAVCRFMLEVLATPNTNTNTNTTLGQIQGQSVTNVLDQRGVEKKQNEQSEKNKQTMFDCVIGNEKIYLEDRVAFASLYLPDQQMSTWIDFLLKECTLSGRIEGLLLSGLRGQGVEILQEYINRYDDIQTAALLVGRDVEKMQSDKDKMKLAGQTPSPASTNPAPGGQAGADAVAVSASPGQHTPSREWQWLHEYRMILNKWQLFVCRASLDVELGQRQREDASKNGLPALGAISRTNVGARPPTMGSRGGAGPSSGGGGRGAGRTKARRVMYALPAHNDFPHIFLRCHYCSSSLPVDSMQQQQHTAFLRKQKPIINFCPNCKKPLPRCYVCQLYMGLVNPHAEVSRIQALKRRSTDKAKAKEKSAVEAAQTQNQNGGSAGGTKEKDDNRDNRDNRDNTGSKEISVSAVTLKEKEKEKEKDSDSQKNPDHNVLDFGRWLFFCQRCKHGGHASCIDSWFEGDNASEKRSVCGVNGCNCRCNSLS